MQRLRFFGSSTVRNAPRLVASELVGAELGSFVRRAGAFLVDVVLWMISVLPAMILLGFFILGIQLGGLQHLRVILSEDAQLPREVVGEAKLRLVRLLERKRPEILPEELTWALANEDEASLVVQLADMPMSINVEISSGAVLSRWDDEAGELVVANDVLFGGRAEWLRFGAFFLFAFTVVPRLLRGRSPGKWLFGLRVVRVDGRRFGWWTAFSRASGYFASFGMLGLGFFETLWDPNAQAAHDKLAGTLVVRAPRFRRAGASAS